MWELDYKEVWVLKNWCFWTVVLENTPESPLDCTEIQPVHPKGDQSWVFVGRTDAEAETPILWSPDAKNWLIGKDPDGWKNWGQEEKGMTAGEKAGWPHCLMDTSFSQLWGLVMARRPGVLWLTGSQRHNWTPSTAEYLLCATLTVNTKQIQKMLNVQCITGGNRGTAFIVFWNRWSLIERLKSSNLQIKSGRLRGHLCYIFIQKRCLRRGMKTTETVRVVIYSI